MNRITDEEFQAANRMTAFAYLQKYQPWRLKKTRTPNEWELTDHDSFKINAITSKWHWKSRGIGGVTALRFLMQVDGMGYEDTVRFLCGEDPSFISPIPEPEPVQRKKFVLPQAHRNCRRVWEYLNRRGISDEVIRYCRSHGILYESSPYHNAVFIGRDETGKPKYAFLRGIYDKNGESFRIEQPGSEKQYAFCVPPAKECSRVAVYEACIDALAHMTLEGGERDKYRLVLGGIAAPKEGQERKTNKKPLALEYFLNHHPEIREIEVCTDNDFAGRWACNNIREWYGNRYRIIENLPQIEGADYGDLAVQAMAEKRKEIQMLELVR